MAVAPSLYCFLVVVILMSLFAALSHIQMSWFLLALA